MHPKTAEANGFPRTGKNVFRPSTARAILVSGGEEYFGDNGGDGILHMFVFIGRPVEWRLVFVALRGAAARYASCRACGRSF